MSLTYLGEQIEKKILAELQPTIEKYAKETESDVNCVRRSVAFLWSNAEQEANREWDAYLSARETGPYGGR